MESYSLKDSDKSRDEKALPKWILLVAAIIPAIGLSLFWSVYILYPSYYSYNIGSIDGLFLGLYLSVSPICLFGYFALKLNEKHRNKLIALVLPIELVSYALAFGVINYYFPLSGTQIGYSLLPTFVIPLLVYIPIALIVFLGSILTRDPGVHHGTPMGRLTCPC